MSFINLTWNKKENLAKAKEVIQLLNGFTIDDAGRVLHIARQQIEANQQLDSAAIIASLTAEEGENNKSASIDAKRLLDEV